MNLLPGAIPYKPHPLSELFPLLEGAAFDALVEDIGANGLREPIVMLDEMVLDGRNRYLAARECGAEIRTVEFGGGDPLAFVVSLNLKRRHLSESQRAMAAARIANLGQGRPNKTADISAISQPEAAEMLNVSRGSVQNATYVQEHATPSLIASVEAGRVSVSAAAEVARLPEADQAPVVVAGPDAIREVASIQRESIPDAEKAILRKQIVEAAESGLKPVRAASRRNPDYVPNPVRDASLAVADHCREAARLLAEHGRESLYGACLTPSERTRLREAVEDAIPALTAFLEADDVRAA